MMPGGLKPAEAATPEVQQLIDGLHQQIKSQAGGAEYPHLKAVSYRTQVVAGTNYLVKVDGGHEHLHVKIYEPLPHTGEPAKVSAVQTKKTHADELAFF
jgi:cystatin-A/B